MAAVRWASNAALTQSATSTSVAIKVDVKPDISWSILPVADARPVRMADWGVSGWTGEDMAGVLIESKVIAA